MMASTFTLFYFQFSFSVVIKQSEQKKEQKKTKKINKIEIETIQEKRRKKNFKQKKLFKETLETLLCSLVHVACAQYFIVCFFVQVPREEKL